MAHDMFQSIVVATIYQHNQYALSSSMQLQLPQEGYLSHRYKISEIHSSHIHFL